MKKVLWLLVFLLCVSSVSATNYYVDKDAIGSNSGTSWDNAWESFSSISWNSIQPGDTVYISGGSTSKTYNELLDVKASGTSGNLVTITKGVDAGHNGDVIIDVNFASRGLNIHGQSYVKVSNLHVYNGGVNLVYLRAGSYLYLDSMNIENSNGEVVYLQGYTDGYPWTIVGLDHVYITNSVIKETRSNVNKQADLIVSYYAVQNVFILNNTLIENNQVSKQHTDNIQWNWGAKSWTIAGNWIENRGSVAAGIQNQAIIVGQSQGVMKIYNNVFYTPNFGDGIDPVYGPKAMNTLMVSDNVGARWEIVGNTFIGGSNSHLVWLVNVNNLEMRNNIFYHVRPVERAPIWFDRSAPTTWDEISNNLYSTNTVPSNGKPISVKNVVYSVQGIQSTYGGELNSISNQNPIFVNFENENFKLQLTSPAIDAGVGVGAPFNVDKDGVFRPQGSAWDIGAYEFGGTANFHPADTNQDGCIQIGEISVYVQLWLNGGATIIEVNNGIQLWLSGAGCSA